MKKFKGNFSNNIKKNIRRILWFTIFTLFLSFFPSSNIYLQSVPKTGGIVLSADLDLPPSPPYPVNYTGIVAPFVSAQGVYISDLTSGATLYKKNEKIRFSPASTTKIFTAWVALKHYDLNDVLTVKTVVNSGRNMGLYQGEKLTVESLLYGALVHSANDAAYTLAENYPGGVTKFIEKMNETAAEMKLTDTRFTNPIGFDDTQHYTTAVDLAKQAQIALSDMTFAKIVATRGITVSDISFSSFHDLTNVNQLLGKISGVAGVKTGQTQFGGEILVAEVKKNGRAVLFVLLKSLDRFSETVALIDWVFGNFVWLEVSEIIPTIH